MTEFVVVKSQDDPRVKEAVDIAATKGSGLGQLIGIIALHAGKKGLVSKI